MKTLYESIIDESILDIDAADNLDANMKKGLEILNKKKKFVDLLLKVFRNTDLELIGVWINDFNDIDISKFFGVSDYSAYIFYFEDDKDVKDYDQVKRQIKIIYKDYKFEEGDTYGGGYIKVTFKGSGMHILLSRTGGLRVLCDPKDKQSYSVVSDFCKKNTPKRK